MDELLKNLSSISWWIGVVIVGILINLFSAYAKPSLDKQLGASLSWFQQRSKKRMVKRAADIEKLRSDSKEQIKLSISALDDRLSAYSYVMLAALLLIIYIEFNSSDRLRPVVTTAFKIVCFSLTSLLLIGGASLNIRSTLRRILLIEAAKEKDSSQGPPSSDKNISRNL